MAEATSATPPHAPLLTVAGFLLAAEAVLLGAIPVLYAVQVALGRRAEDLAGTATTAVLAAACAAGLILLARSVLRRRRWARAPALVAQALFAVVAGPVATTPRWYVGAPLLLVAGVCAGALLAPRGGGLLQD